MKRSLLRLTSFVFVLFFTQVILNLAHSNESDKFCTWHDNKIAVYDSIWILDPFLENQLRDQMNDKGYTQQEIDYEIKHNDWVGFRVECLVSVKPNPNPTHPGDVLLYSEPFMVVNEYARHYHDELMKNENTKSLSE